MLNVGFASVTFRKKSIEEVVAIAVKSGAKCLEWGGDVHVKNLNDAVEARELCVKAGIAICSYGSYYMIGSHDTEKWKQICTVAVALGAKTVRVWLGDKSSRDTTQDEYENLLSDARIVCDIASAFNLLVSAECHRNTYNDNSDSIIRFCNDLQADNFRTYFQSLYLDRKYDADRLIRAKHLCENVHVSFRDLIREQQRGKKDNEYIAFIIEELKVNGYNTNVLVEFTRWDSVNQLINDINIINKYIFLEM